VYRPQQNGVAERATRTMAEGITAMLTESGLSASFLGEALASYVYVWNEVLVLLRSSAYLNFTFPDFVLHLLITRFLLIVFVSNFTHT
jgi:hypothetical protein